MILALALAAAIQAGPAPTPDPHLVTIGGYTCMAYPESSEPVCDQYTVDLTLTDDPIADCLEAEGWQGSDDDGRAVFYAPWIRIERCTGTEV